jgi:hypothetical protein
MAGQAWPLASQRSAICWTRCDDRPPGRAATANKAAIDAGQTDVVLLLACLI